MNPPRCRRCHRPLTVTVGGLGPVCAKRESPATTVAPHRSPVIPRRRVSAIPGQIPLDLETAPQETP